MVDPSIEARFSSRMRSSKPKFVLTFPDGTTMTFHSKANYLAWKREQALKKPDLRRQ